MSLEIVRHVNAQHPALLRENVNRTCYQFVVLVIAALRAAGHQAFHVCKTAGEGQYTPPGFQPRDVIGLDGKGYRCSGVSHDALWCDGQQFDTVARGNDSPDPIFNADGSPMTGEPVWNAIPSQYWRPNNPPLTTDAPPVVTPSLPPYPSNEADVDGAGVALFADFASAGQQPNPQMFRFAFRVAHDWIKRLEPDLPSAVAKHRREWRQILGLPPLP